MTQDSPDLVEQLERLTNLHNAGHLSDDEFGTAKDRLIRQPAQPTGVVQDQTTLRWTDQPASTARLVLIAGGALVALGAFVGPWATAFGAFTVGGGAGDGPIIGVAGLLLIAVAIANRLLPAATILAAACATYGFWQVARLADGPTQRNDVLLEIGWGLYAILIGGLISVFAASFAMGNPMSVGGVIDYVEIARSIVMALLAIVATLGIVGLVTALSGT